MNVIGKVGRAIRARLEIDHPSVPKRSTRTVIASVLNFSVVQTICGCCFQNFRIQLPTRILTQTCIPENNGGEFQMKKRELCPKNTLLSPPGLCFVPPIRQWPEAEWRGLKAIPWLHWPGAPCASGPKTFRLGDARASYFVIVTIRKSFSSDANPPTNVAFPISSKRVELRLTVTMSGCFSSPMLLSMRDTVHATFRSLFMWNGKFPQPLWSDLVCIVSQTAISN